jgi:TetR/AcrR family transcriptional regulator, transcriptional repressor of aconitase
VPRATTEHTAEVRQRILDGAHRAFRARGYRGTSIPLIAAEAGVSVGLIYRYFASKEELFLSVCQAQSDLQLNELAALLSTIPDPHARLDAAIRFFVASLMEDGWGAIIIHAQAEADRNPRLRDMLIRISDQHRGFSAMFIRELIARGEAPPDMDVDSASLAVALLLQGAVADQAERGASWDPEAVVRAITTVLSWPLASRSGAAATVEAVPA